MSRPPPAALVPLTVGGTIRMATLWKIERRDSVKMRYTDHDNDIAVDVGDGDGVQTFKSRGSFTASARQKLANMRVRNLELAGYISTDDITHDDLRAGLYRDAKITEYLVDWYYPFAGVISTSTFWLAETAFNGETWSAQVHGITRRFEQKVGRTYSRTCDYVLGDSRCGKALGAFTFTGSVITVIRNRLVVEINLSNVAGYFKYGKLTWTSGDSLGTVSEVKEHTTTAGGGRLDLALQTPGTILVGDTFSIVAGCDKIWTTCRDKFANLSRFGGFPYIPGTDKLFTTPDNK